MADQPQKLYLIKGAKYVVLTTKDAGKPRATDSVKALAKKLADHF